MSVRVQIRGDSTKDYRAFDFGDEGRGMRYGQYRRPFPLDKVKILNTRTYGTGSLLRMPYLPPGPVNVGRHLPSGRTLTTANRRRLSFTAASQWWEETPGRGSARHSNAYRQFAGGDEGPRAGMGDLSDDIKTIIDRAVGGKLSVVSQKLDDVATTLKISTGASVLAAAVALYAAFGRRR